MEPGTDSKKYPIQSLESIVLSSIQWNLVLTQRIIPFNLWRACHWYNMPLKKATRPSKHDCAYYFKHNVHITTSGNFNIRGLKFCMEELGTHSCLYAIGESKQLRRRQ